MPKITFFSLLLYLWILSIAAQEIENLNEELLQKIKILTDKKFSTGKSELVFLLDRSGSVGVYNFEIEKAFIESLLQHFVISPNATRVAIISYSDDVVRHMDYLSEPKNRCFFAQEFQTVTYKDSGATDIASALEEAYDVLKNARPNVKKVAILLSDGFATKGEHPKTAATKLKTSGVEVFTFGVGIALQKELSQLASSKTHSFVCSDFQEFKLLAEVIRGDPHETAWALDEESRNCDRYCNSPYRGLPDDPGCCDPAAKCTCALQSGIHTCVCGPGFYALSGLMGDCKQCPKGTYKDNYEPVNQCKHCPPHSTTVNTGSTSTADCKCKIGYEGNPSKNVSCTIKKCPPLQIPHNGHIIGHCENTYNSACYFACNPGFELQNKDSEKRMCQNSEDWSGSTAICQKIRCAEPVPPEQGIKNCSSNDFLIGTVCDFSCEPGYMLVGEKRQKCLSTKRWSPDNVECFAKTCPALVKKKHLLIRRCETGINYEFRTACVFQCPSGFKLAGSEIMVCDENGKWRGIHAESEQPVCRDNEPPKIKCPPHLSVQSDKGKNYTQIKLPQPTVHDNSGYFKLSMFPKLKSPAKFNIGIHEITFKANDASFLTSVCKMTIEVKDLEPPTVIFCPNKIEVNTTDFEIAVNWKNPIFIDNTKAQLEITSTNKPDDLFSPGRHTVTYEAVDSSGNTARCIFDVIVSKNECPYHPPPVNGAIACDYWLFGQMCDVYCNENFDFVTTPADWYICDKTNEWKTQPEGYLIPWPDCAEWYVPQTARRMMTSHYYSGHCRDPRIQRLIQEAYMNHFRAQFNVTEFCAKKGSCLIDSIKVTCGKTNYTIPRRPKRDIWDFPINDVIEIEVEITVSSDRKDDSSAQDVEELMRTIDEIMKTMKDDKAKSSISFPLQDEKESNLLIEPAVVDIGDVELICYNGAILKDKECVNCPVGTYHNTNNGTCDRCPYGCYQDEAGSTDCISCPNGTWTESDGSKNETDCKEICLPGTYSLTGLETCEACPLGTYQSLPQQTYCISCSPETTTWREGASSEEDCRETCPPGTYSEIGLEPCTPCPIGYYQSEYGQMLCTMCPGNLTTVDVGSSSEISCVEYDHCTNTSCMNGGECFSEKFDFICLCQVGFEGKFCEKNIDDCQSMPCAEGSTCIDGVADYHCICSPGFTGETCEEEINECEDSPCQNFAICVDKVDGFECLCLPGYEGQFCEIDIDICKKYPCMNGICEEINNDRLCHCLPGYEGEDCSINIDDCVSINCENGGSCVDGVLNYTCFCLPGFVGHHCEINVDECTNNLCEIGATCIDDINGYKCLCPPGFSGLYCETKLSPDFTMSFENPSISNFASINERIPSMTTASVSMWVQTTDTDRPGAMLSYAANNQLHQIPNALTLTDYGSLKIYINGRPIYTNLKLNDGKWHHIALTWSSENGNWKLYHNGTVIAAGDGVGAGEQIPGGGFLIIGQEQDCVGGDFSLTEAFTGNITKVNLWNQVLSADDVKQLCHQKEIPGWVTAWPDFQRGISGHIRIYTSSMPLE